MYAISCRKWISCGWLDKENLPSKSRFFSVFAWWWWVMCLKILLIIDLTEKSKNLGNMEMWKLQQQIIQNLGKSCKEHIGNNVFHFLGSGSVSQHGRVHSIFSAHSQISKCPANWLLVESVYAENKHSFSLKFISVCLSMEESGERRDLQSERTNDQLMMWKQFLWERQKKRSPYLHCAFNSEVWYLLYCGLTKHCFM